MSKSNDLKFPYALSLALQLGFLIVFSIVGFLALGLWIDQKLNTSPWFLLAGIIIGVVMAVYESYQLVAPLLKDHSDKK